MSKQKISEAAYDCLASYKGALPVATLMGEFSAGKSTLLNFLLGDGVAPTKVTATHMPPTWFTHSAAPYSVGIKWDGEEEEVDLSDGETNLRDDYLLIRRGLDCPALNTCDLIDTPGISDPGLQKGALRFLTRYTDFVIWCTAANQAWRQTENAAYGKLSQAVKDQSILIITRTDKLRSDKDRAKVLKRVKADAGPKFKFVLPLQTPKAAAIAAPDRTDDPSGAWVKTGGYDVTEAISDTCAAISPKAFEPKEKKAPQKADGKVSKSKKKAAAKAAKKKKKNQATAQSAEASSKALELFVGTLNEIKTIPDNSQYCSEIEHLIASISCESDRVRTYNPTLQHCLRIQNHDLDICRFLSQINREFTAFEGQERIPIDAGFITSVTTP